MRAAALAGALLAALAAPGAGAQSVALAGQMGGKALLVIDGRTQMLAVGESAAGVRLLAIEPDGARVEAGGVVRLLRAGASPVSVGHAGSAAGASTLVLTAGPGGHFVTDGAINGRAVRFMVDTGASLVALPAAEAQRLGLDLSTAERGLAQTANGTVPVHRITLARLRVGEVELRHVDAVVVPAPMPHVLLGNSALARFQMRRENDVMRLELRR